MTKLPAFLLATAATGAVLAFAPSLAPSTDYSTLPPDPYEMEQALSAEKMDLSAAASMVANKVNGSVAAAIASTTPEGVRYAITAYSDGECHEFVVSGAGEVISDTVKPRFPGEDVGDAEMVTMSTGLMFYDLVEGDGPTPASPASEVSVHYTGYLTDGTKFDSSLDRGMPTTFPLNRVIPGWTQGVGSMKVGGKRKLVIPFELAYGPQGRPPVIPPKAMLVFDVELVEIVKD